jgi:hypothetical protein
MLHMQWAPKKTFNNVVYFTALFVVIILTGRDRGDVRGALVYQSIFVAQGVFNFLNINPHIVQGGYIISRRAVVSSASAALC